MVEASDTEHTIHVTDAASQEAVETADRAAEIALSASASAEETARASLERDRVIEELVTSCQTTSAEISTQRVEISQLQSEVIRLDQLIRTALERIAPMVKEATAEVIEEVIEEALTTATATAPKENTERGASHLENPENVALGDREETEAPQETEPKTFLKGPKNRDVRRL